MGRASANGLRGLAIAAVAALLVAAAGRSGRRQEEGRKRRQAHRAHHAAAPGGRRRCDQRQGEGARAAESWSTASRAPAPFSSPRRRRSSPASTPSTCPSRPSGKSAIGRLLGHRAAAARFVKGEGKKKGKKSAGKSSLRDHPSIATRRCAASDRRTRPRGRTTARRSTPRTRTAATSWIRRSACSRGRTTTSPRRTRRPTRGAGSTSTPNSTPANIHGVHIDTDRLQPGRRVQPRQPDHAQDPAGRDAGGVRQHRLRAGQRPASLRGRRTSRSW